ncbi:3-hydroxyacyl-CoA dehydrogenase NAD-binding domain-containing protein [Halomonas sp. KM007]|jgi:3-hydroxyacyl-CoA dehydrogenase
MSTQVAVIGAGLIGRGWAIVFARAGVTVRLHDVDEQQLTLAKGLVMASLFDLQDAGLIDQPVSWTTPGAGASRDIVGSTAGRTPGLA